MIGDYRIEIKLENGSITNLYLIGESEKAALHSLVLNWYDVFSGKETVGIEKITLHKVKDEEQ